jgi:hypothetical protein
MAGCQRIAFDGDLGHNIAVLGDGRLATIVSEPEPFNDLSRERPERWTSLRYSATGGRTWTAPVRGFAYPAGPGVASASLLAVDQRERLHAFGLRFYGVGRDGLPMHSVLLHTVSDDAGTTWTAVKEVDFGHEYTGALNSVLTLASGRIVLPLSYYAPERSSGRFVSMTVYSDDGGATWGCSNDCAVAGGGAYVESGAVEPVIVQLRGGLVWMVIRTTTGYFWESFSSDGAIWTPPRQTRIVSSNAPAGVLRLADGCIVLAWNNLYGEPFREGAISYARQQLHAAISADNGQTWSTPKVIAQVAPGDLPQAQTTYPFLCQAPDSAIVLLYHRVHARPGRDWHHPIRELVRIAPDWLAAEERP